MSARDFSTEATSLGPSCTQENGAADRRLSEDQAASLAISMGLLKKEFEAIRHALAGVPSQEELAVFAGMWSEHCSYKSTRHLLATLPKEGQGVLAGPGSHAGVVDVGEGWAVAFKIESHNHPSAVEPYQGAATGVGGILRDVIAQGARPCALLDFLCFGDRHSRDTARIQTGVVSGIAGYGNAIGVPNVGGRTHYHPGYEGRPLVNALAAGLLRPSEQRTARAQGVGNVVLLVGAPTGRDGILGAAFASEVLGSQAENRTRRSHVQIGDPFAGKQLMEALLALPAELQLVAAQDLGACGIACATFEMAALGGVGMVVDLDKVPLREPDMAALEIFLSESQERFALVFPASQIAAAQGHFGRYGLGAAAIAVLNDSGRVRVQHRGRVCIDLPAQLVAGGAPRSEFPVADSLPEAPQASAIREYPDLVRLNPEHPPILSELPALLAEMPDAEAIYSHFDQTVGNRTVRGPGQAAAAVLRLPQSTRGFALTLTGRGDLCLADPYRGSQAALGEALRRLACVGSRMLAITDGLNFGSPRDPVEHRRIIEVIAGLRDGLRTLGVPVTGGNVSLYNQSPAGPIPPSPMIGALGLVADVRRVPAARLRAGESLLLCGRLADEPTASLWARRQPDADRVRPSCDLVAEQALADFLCAALASDTLGERPSALWPVTMGGLLCCLAKIAARSQLGMEVQFPVSERPHWQLFGEHAAQVVLACPPAAVPALTRLATEHGVPLTHLGSAEGSRFCVNGHGALPLSVLQRAAGAGPAPFAAAQQSGDSFVSA